MGNKIKIKLTVLCLLFIVTSAFIYYQTTPVKLTKAATLSSFLMHINGYTPLEQIQLNESASQMLKLDDYLFCDYQDPIGGKVNLYVGYYYTAQKAYASHSPLVCYPSQGWKIVSGPDRSTLMVEGLPIHFEQVVTSYNRHKELVLYWYQSHGDAHTQIYRNKISIGFNKFKYNDEQHGFVRVSTAIANDNHDEARSRAIAFIQSFYPKFQEFVLAE